jgi:lysophospholipase L1-like esterase
MIEHEQDHGFLETRLTQRFPSVSITFRNFGWSGDNVSGTARTSGFQNPDGFARLLKEVDAYKPTVVFIGYGNNESFGGPQGLAGFVQGFTTLLDRLGPLRARTVVLSPTAHEDLGRPYPDPAAHNRHLEIYTAALAKIAAERKLWFVDLFHPFVHAKKLGPGRRLTTNGLLPNEAGYSIVAREIEEKLFGARPNWSLDMDNSGRVLKSTGVAIAAVKAGAASVSFELKPQLLGAPGPADTEMTGPRLRLVGWGVESLLVRINGRDVRQASAAAWDKGVTLPDPTISQTGKLRAAIIKKSELFARRWRPFNDHERHWSFIGGDFKLYDKEIAEHERVIAGLRRPLPIAVEIVVRNKGR